LGVLHPEKIGIELTEGMQCIQDQVSAAITFPSPIKVHGDRQVTKDQIEDYAKRKGVAVAEVERWLAPYSYTNRFFSCPSPESEFGVKYIPAAFCAEFSELGLGTR